MKPATVHTSLVPVFLTTLLGGIVGCSDVDGAPAGPSTPPRPPPECQAEPPRCGDDLRSTDACVDGKKVHAACSGDCLEGACVDGLAVHQVKSSLSLPPGEYRIAVVDTSLEDGTLAFPVALEGTVKDAPPTAPSVMGALSAAASRLARGHASSRTAWRRYRGTHRTFAGALPSMPTALPVVGDAREFHPQLSTVDGPLPSHLRLVTAEANFWVEDVAGDEVISLPELNALGVRYAHAMKRQLELFGPITDVDQNGKVDVFVSKKVSDDGALAFVHPTNFRPPGWFDGFLETDHGEVIYLAPAESALAVPELAATLAHETQHLWFFGHALEPYVASGELEPEDMFADLYAFEGMAEFASMMSGLAYSGLSVSALRLPHQFGLGALVGDEYFEDAERSVVTYGMAALLTQYQFDRAGGARLVDGRLVDEGGKGIFEALTKRAGAERYTLTSGEKISAWYPDFAAALLASTLPDRKPAKPSHSFVPTVLDPVGRGPVGAVLDGVFGDPNFLLPGPLVEPLAWSAREATLRHGGIGFFGVVVDGAPAKLTVTAPTSVALVARK